MSDGNSDPNFPGWGLDGRALHEKLPPSMWCVTPQDLRFLRQEVRQAIDQHMVMPIIQPVFDDERPDPFTLEDETIGPNMYNLTDNYIKPLTLDAGRTCVGCGSFLPKRVTAAQLPPSMLSKQSSVPVCYTISTL